MMSRLKFCLAGEYPADTSRIGGGVLYVMYLLGEAFAERDDIDFHIVASAKGIDGVKVVERPGVTIHYIGEPRHTIVPNVLTQPSRIAPVMRELKPDVVNSHGHITTEAAIMAGCKVVHTIHGVTHAEVRYLRGRDKLAARLQCRLQYKALSRADAVISVAQYGLDAYARWIKGPTAVFNIPVEDVFAQVPPLSECKGVLYVGVIGYRKNLRALVRAMPALLRRHPDAVLHVCGGVGDPRYKADLDAYIEREGIGDSIRFLGVVDRYKIAELLENSIALALPSHQETSPVVIAQAMSAGRIPVAAPAGGTAEVVEDGVSGFIVGADDSQKLADRLAELMDDFGMAQRMGAAAREFALEHNDRRKVADRILTLCSSLVNEPAVV
jgi:glycosyltransferase involved in cell wall biosynthesis